MSLPSLTLAIRGGTILDGTGAPPIRADIGISGDTIVQVGHDIGAAEEDIDAEGLYVTPGFIDTHSHSEFTILASPEAEGKISQGITTEINGNCGLSAAPLMGAARERREADQEEYGIHERWESLDEYFALLEGREPAVNYATLAGHGNIRASVLGYEDRKPAEDESLRMAGLLGEAVQQGAIGLSTGLIYPPGIYSDIEEIAALARAGLLAADGGAFIYTSHMRSEGEFLLESIDETLEVGRLSGVPVHISHLKTAGRANWNKAANVVGRLDSARGDGLGVTADRYPYTASATDLDAVLPAWMFEGGTEAELRRLGDPSVSKRIEEFSATWPDEWDAIGVSDVSTDANKWTEGLSIAEIARRWNVSPLDSIIRLLREEKLRVGAIFHSMCDENMLKFLSLPYCMVGSDSSARSFSGVTRRGMPHPRGFGSMPRYVRMCLDGRLQTVSGRALDLASGVAKITSLPARIFGLSGRGRIAAGMKADLVAFDPGNIRDTAGFDEPFSAPAGIAHVIVNGVIAQFGGAATGRRPGRVLRSGRG